MFRPSTIIEPFRIKMVEPLPRPTREHREAALRKAGYNLFNLEAADVVIDLMTDSGTGAMSQEQWSALLRGDESYAGARSFSRFREAVHRLTGLKHVIPVHQGRAAERMLFDLRGGPGKVVPGNTHFDTTRANIEASGAEALDFVIPEGIDPRSEYPFKGNIDIAQLAEWLESGDREVPLAVTVITASGDRKSVV